MSAPSTRPVRFEIAGDTKANPIVLDETTGANEAKVISVWNRPSDGYISDLTDTAEYAALRAKLEGTIPSTLQRQIKERLGEQHNKFVVRHGYRITMTAYQQLAGLSSTKFMTDAPFCAYMGMLSELSSPHLKLIKPADAVAILDRKSSAPASIAVRSLVPIKAIDHWYILEVNMDSRQMLIHDPWCKGSYDTYVKETAALSYWANRHGTNGQMNDAWKWIILHPLSSTVLADVNILVCAMTKRMMRTQNHEAQRRTLKDYRLTIVWELMSNKLLASV